MKAVVAGGAGFIGSHFCDLLLQKDWEVVCVDNLITGTEKNILHDLSNKSFKFMEHDISIPFNIDGKLDFVINLASPASPVDYMNFPIETMKAGSLGTLNTLELAKAKGAKYLISSTSEVYGDPLVSPQPEGYWGNVNPIGPRSVYDESKRFSEALVTAYKRKFGLHTKIARFFNTYGPRMKALDGRVVPNFIVQALKGEALTVYGDGSQTRSFCYIDDLIDGLYKFMTSDITEPVNLGNPNEFTILEFSKLVNKYFGRKEDNIILEPLPTDDPRQRRPDISKAKSLLGWEPKIGIDEGMKRTIEWFSTISTRQEIF